MNELLEMELAGVDIEGLTGISVAELAGLEDAGDHQEEAKK
jgi:hypothetical protein